MSDNKLNLLKNDLDKIKKKVELKDFSNGEVATTEIVSEREQKETESYGKERDKEIFQQEVEKAIEKEKEKKLTSHAQTEEEANLHAAAGPTVKTPVLIEIENILEEGMADIYENLPENVKWQFKNKGEETATKIDAIINSAKIKTKKILELIKEWLLIVPGINKFFLEQEAKIKTDKIIIAAAKAKK